MSRDHLSPGPDPLAATPEQPYYAVIFSSLRADDDGVAYGVAAARMAELAAAQPGYLGVEAARDGIGITVSYWRDLESIRAWKREVEHAAAQGEGRRSWYSRYVVRIARVERAYDFTA